MAAIGIPFSVKIRAILSVLLNKVKFETHSSQKLDELNNVERRFDYGTHSNQASFSLKLPFKMLYMNQNRLLSRLLCIIMDEIYLLYRSKVYRMEKEGKKLSSYQTTLIAWRIFGKVSFLFKRYLGSKTFFEEFSAHYDTFLQFAAILYCYRINA